MFSSSSFFLEFKTEMSKIRTLFSLKHLLILSVALNVGLILRVLFESEENSFILHQKQRWSVIGGCGRPQQQHQEEEAHVSRSSLPHLSFSPPSSSSSPSQDEGKRVINLDQLHRSGGGCEFHVYDYDKGSWGGDDSGVGFMARARCFGDNQEFWVELKLKGF